MRYTDVDQRIGTLASRQYGAVSRQQAFQHGATERFVQRRLKSGDWSRPVPAVYVVTGCADTWRRQCKIAELSVDNSALCGRSAATLHGLTGFRPGPIELLVPVNAYCRHPFAVTHRYAGADTVTVSGMRVTTVPQTLFDLAAVTGLWRLERALDDALLAGTTTLGALEQRLTFYLGSRRKGLPRIRTLIVERQEDGWVPPESELEALLFDVLDRLPSKPQVLRQASPPWRSRVTGRVDALLPDHRLVIEADGRRWHARLTDFERDRQRDNDATANGYRVLRFTWTHLRHFVPDTIDTIERTVTNHVTPAA